MRNGCRACLRRCSSAPLHLSIWGGREEVLGFLKSSTWLLPVNLTASEKPMIDMTLGCSMSFLLDWSLFFLMVVFSENVANHFLLRGMSSKYILFNLLVNTETSQTQNPCAVQFKLLVETVLQALVYTELWPGFPVTLHHLWSLTFFLLVVREDIQTLWGQLALVSL